MSLVVLLVGREYGQDGERQRRRERDTIRRGHSRGRCVFLLLVSCPSRLSRCSENSKKGLGLCDPDNSKVKWFLSSSFLPLLEYEPLDESLGRKLRTQALKVEELTLKVAERRKRVPEQVKMLLDDAIKRQSALADRIEFESQEDPSALESAEQGRRSLPSRR